MWLTYRTVMANPGLTREGVLDRVAPAAMRAKTPGGDGIHVVRALDALVKLGKWQSGPVGGGSGLQHGHLLAICSI